MLKFSLAKIFFELCVKTNAEGLNPQTDIA